MLKNIPQITIIGQTNVGKSTLFNALSKFKKSIVTSISGTTRDDLTTVVNFAQRPFLLRDTGGFNRDTRVAFEQTINQKTEKALKESDWLFWLVDFRKPLDKNDFYINQKIKKYKQKTILLINKAEKFHHFDQIQHFYQLGIKTQIPIAAKNKLYFSNLLTWIDKHIPINDQFSNPLITKKILILGQPNVGKSSLFNAICEEEKAIVWNQSHTTTNIVEKLIFYKEKRLCFLDSSGLRRKKQRASLLEQKSFHQIQREINSVDLIFFVLDISQELMVQDKKIINFILKWEKRFVIIANKYDLVSENDMQLKKKIYGFFAFVKPLKTPIYFVSTLNFLKAQRSIKRLLNGVFS